MTNIEKALKEVTGLTPEEFASKARQGNFDFKTKHKTISVDEDRRMYVVYNYEKLLIDPKAWKAVGEVEGWGRTMTSKGNPVGEYKQSYDRQMRQFVDVLIRLSEE